MGKIIITRADEVVDTISKQKISAVLSIEHPDVKEGEKGYAPRITNIPQKILEFWDTEDESFEQAPDTKQIKDGMFFALDHLKEGDVIVHCNAGKARSAAVALGVLSLIQTEKSDDELVEELVKIRSIAAPNILVVEKVDKIVGRNLTQSIKQHKHISEQRRLCEEARLRFVKNNPEKLPQKKLIRMSYSS